MEFKVSTKYCYFKDAQTKFLSSEAAIQKEIDFLKENTYELIYEIEEATSVSIPDEIANTFNTVGDAYNYIKENSGK